MIQEQSSRDAAHSRLALLRELQLSLSVSRAALLALDLSGIEQGTREQIELSHRLAEEMAGENRMPERDLELKRAENEVRQALRLHAALLARERAKLRVLANMLAGPSVNYSVNNGVQYGDPGARNMEPPRTCRSNPRREF